MNQPSPHRRQQDIARRNAWAMRVFMLALLAAVIFSMLRWIPLTTKGEISSWNARRLLRQADNLVRTAERASDAAPLYESAEGIYRQVARGPAVRPAYRVKAAAALRGLMDKAPEKIGDIHETVALLAGQLTEQRDKEKLAPVAAVVNSAWKARAGAPQEPPPAAAMPPAPTPPAAMKRNSRVIARVGGADVTDDEILYAWQAMNGDTLPTTATQRLFVFKYLNMTLLADEAARRGLANDPRAALDLKINRLGALCDALDRDIEARLPEIPETGQRAFYEKHRAEFSAAAARVGQKDAFESVRPSLIKEMKREALAQARAELLKKLHAVNAGESPQGPGAPPGPAAAEGAR